MVETLLLCPFCGGEAEFETYGGTACAVVCQSCHCGTPTMSLADGMAAVSRWNLRAERTCRVVRSGEPSSTGVPRERHCSECGGRLTRFGAYCPDCGARVLDEEVER